MRGGPRPCKTDLAGAMGRRRIVGKWDAERDCGTRRALGGGRNRQPWRARAHARFLSLAQTQQALARFMRSPKAVGLVVSEFNAECEDNPKLARQLIDLLIAALA